MPAATGAVGAPDMVQTGTLAELTVTVALAGELVPKEFVAVTV